MIYENTLDGARALMSSRGLLVAVLLAFAACRGAVERTAPASEGQTAA